MRSILPLAAVLALAAPARAATGFTIVAPKGFTNLSPSTINDNAKNVPPDVANLVRDTRYAFYAADLSRRGDWFMENENVVVEPGSLSITSETLDTYEADTLREVAAMPSIQVRFLDAQLRKIGDVQCARFVQELTIQGRKVKQLAWLVPGDGERAVLTFSTTFDRFDHYAPLFDEAALQTGGLHKHAGLGALSPFQRGAIVGLLLGLIAVVVVIARRKGARA